MIAIIKELSIHFPNLQGHLTYTTMARHALEVLVDVKAKGITRPARTCAHALGQTILLQKGQCCDNLSGSPE